MAGWPYAGLSSRLPLELHVVIAFASRRWQQLKMVKVKSVMSVHATAKRRDETRFSQQIDPISTCVLIYSPPQGKFDFQKIGVGTGGEKGEN